MSGVHERVDKKLFEHASIALPYLHTQRILQEMQHAGLKLRYSSRVHPGFGHIFRELRCEWFQRLQVVFIAL